MLGGCGDGDGEPPAPADRLREAVAAIRDCRVRSVTTLHSGLVVLELRDGRALELDSSDYRRVQHELERARPRCGDVVVAIE